MSTISITSHDGKSFDAYIARPTDKPNAPVIIVIQEIFGINAELRAKCETLAKLGYIAIAPDLFWRIEPGIDLVDSVPEQLERAFELFGLFDTTLGIEDLRSTLDHAKTLEGSNGKVGCVGYCLGGKLAYMMATQTSVDASVGYYGVMIDQMLDQAKNISKPLMLHIAEKDEFVPPEAQKKIHFALSDNPLVILHDYAGADHAFARGEGMHYKEDAARLANERTTEFFAEHL